MALRQSNPRISETSMKYQNFLTLLPVVSATSGLFERIPELRLTGLTEEQLDRLIQPRVSVISVANSSCPANVTAANLNVTFPEPTFPSTQDLLKRNYFVEKYIKYIFKLWVCCFNTSVCCRDGTKLKLVGKDFRIVGANAYWLGLDENVMYVLLHHRCRHSCDSDQRTFTQSRPVVSQQKTSYGSHGYCFSQYTRAIKWHYKL